MWKLGWNMSSLHTCWLSFFKCLKQDMARNKDHTRYLELSVTLHMTSDSAAVSSVGIINSADKRADMQICSLLTCPRSSPLPPSLPSLLPCPPTLLSHLKKKRKENEKEKIMCKPSESHRGGEGGEEGVGEGGGHGYNMLLIHSVLSLKKEEEKLSKILWLFLKLDKCILSCGRHLCEGDKDATRAMLRRHAGKS